MCQSIRTAAFVRIETDPLIGHCNALVTKITAHVVAIRSDLCKLELRPLPVDVHTRLAIS